MAEQSAGEKPPEFVQVRGDVMPAAHDTGGTHAPFDYPQDENESRGPCVSSVKGSAARATVGNIGLLVVLCVLVPADRHPYWFWAGFSTLIATFIAICWWKGEPPRWRWG